MTTEKICFRYDGSPEAIEAYRVWDDIGIIRVNRPDFGFYYLSNGTGSTNFEPIPNEYRLVTPAEFIRLVKGETEWMPKYGEEVEGTHLGKPVSGLYLASVDLIHGRKRHILQGKLEQNDLIIATTIRPIRKSLREELSKLIPLINADDIINLFKKYKDEL